MNMDVIDRLMQIQWSEESGSTRIYEESALRRHTRIQVSGQSSTRMIRRLKNEVRQGRQCSLTVGTFLKEMRSARGFSDRDVSARLNIPRTTYHLLEEDGISPFHIEPRIWRKLMLLGGLSMDALERIIRTTCTFHSLAPSLHPGLHRQGLRSARLKKILMSNVAGTLLPSEEQQRVHDLMEQIAN